MCLASFPGLQSQLTRLCSGHAHSTSVELFICGNWCSRISFRDLRISFTRMKKTKISMCLLVRGSTIQLLGQTTLVYTTSLYYWYWAPMYATHSAAHWRRRHYTCPCTFSRKLLVEAWAAYRILSSGTQWRSLHQGSLIHCMVHCSAGHKTCGSTKISGQSELNWLKIMHF